MRVIFILALLFSSHPFTVKATEDQKKPKKPSEIFSKNALTAAMKAISEGDVDEIKYEPSLGYDGEGKYQQPGWKLSANGARPSVKEEGQKGVVPVSFPMGAGFAMMNGCYGSGYKKGDPCFDYVRASIECVDQMESANFIGVGFDGRGFYSADSRRSSIIQRKCEEDKKFWSQQLPDSMSAFGIYDYSVTTNTFSSSDEYVSHLQHKSSTSQTSHMFHSEKQSASKSFKMEVDAFIVSAGGSSSSKSQHSSQSSEDSASSASNSHSKNSRVKKQRFMATCDANLKLFEIALDAVGPDDLLPAFLRDFLALPPQWQGVGDMEKLQDFIIRYGTHYITAAKFGGTLKIIRTSEADSSMSKEEYASESQSSFSKMFAQSSSSSSTTEQHSSSIVHDESSTSTEKKESKDEKGSTGSKSESSKSGSEESHQSKSLKTDVLISGGDIQMSKAVMDFYSPSFRADFSEWLDSVPQHPKPYDFSLSKVSKIFDMNADSLFLGNGSRDGTTKEDFMEDFKGRRAALERAEVIYMAEGPFDMSSFEVKGGFIGCESNFLDIDKIPENMPKTWPTWADMKSKIFRIEFSLPWDLSWLDSDAKLVMRHYHGLWMYKFPGQSFTIRNSCPDNKERSDTLCVADLEMTYDENEGYVRFLHDLSEEKKREANRTSEIYDYGHERALGIVSLEDQTQIAKSAEVGVDKYFKAPCNIRWNNNHRIDIDNEISCLHFTASTAGSIYLVFADIPSDRRTWFYIRINSGGISFYQQMSVRKIDTGSGLGNLGDEKLYESYFVCIKQGSGENIQMTYGKSNGQKHTGVVKSAFEYPGTQDYHVSYYSFGTGQSDLTIDSPLVEPNMPEVSCPFRGYHKKGTGCAMTCHPECDLCHQPEDNTKCLKCKHIIGAAKVNGKFVPACISSCDKGEEAEKVKGEGEGGCIKCDFGMMNANPKNESCKQCPDGEYQDQIGQGKCKECRPRKERILMKINKTRCYHPCLQEMEANSSDCTEIGKILRVKPEGKNKGPLEILKGKNWVRVLVESQAEEEINKIANDSCIILGFPGGKLASPAPTSTSSPPLTQHTDENKSAWIVTRHTCKESRCIAHLKLVLSDGAMSGKTPVAVDCKEN